MSSFLRNCIDKPCKAKYYIREAKICIRNEKEGKEMDQEKIEVTIDITNIDELTEKTEKLVSLLKEAKSLINDLALADVDISPRK